MPFTKTAYRSDARAAAAMPVAAAVLLLAPLQADAGADCTISSIGASFGTYDPLLTQADDTTSSVTVTCNYVAPDSTTVNYAISVSNGMFGTSPTTRNTGFGAARLGYNVYADSARSQVLGNGSSGTVVATGSLKVGPGVGNNTRSSTHTFYARSPALQDVAAGAYADTLVLTLTY
jgi:spore coat protein U-like protein